MIKNFVWDISQTNQAKCNFLKIMSILINYGKNDYDKRLDLYRYSERSSTVYNC